MSAHCVGSRREAALCSAVVFVEELNIHSVGYVAPALALAWGFSRAGYLFPISLDDVGASILSMQSPCFDRRQPGSTDVGLEKAHRKLKISPAQFDEVAAELRRTLDVLQCRNAKRKRFWLRLPHTRMR